ncbi:hypothetical protein R1flu_019021 [Riccia fluitans]|uniref:BZIP domain-containing protein n=1 Tax=Riccia fluitans TaxID=41844 RepID=A0ABD1ZHG8_9MARC
MCLPPDVSTPALPPIGRRRDVNPSQWATDPRAHQNWGAPPPQSNGAGWPSYFNMDYYNIPQSGYGKEDACGANVIEAAPLGSLLASALAQQEVSKTWQPQANWAAPQNNSFYCSPQAMQTSYGGGMDAGSALMQSAQSAQGALAGQEALCGVESKEEDRLQAGSLIDELYQEARLEQDPAGRKFCNPVSKMGKTAGQKAKHAARSGVKKETSGPEVCIGESDLDLSDEEGEGAPVISEKRRKRMLSNRASAQRSRQRRQERLDTLEVLVAQLRVENAALKTKANTAVASVKKLEDENKVLRERLDAKEHNLEYEISLRKDCAENDNQSLQTTGGNSDMSGIGTSQEGVTISLKTRPGDSDSSSENSGPNKRDVEVGTNNITKIVNTGNNYRVGNQQGSKTRKRCSEGPLEKEWSYFPSYTTVFGTENGETVENTACKAAIAKSTSKMGECLDYTQEGDLAGRVFECLFQINLFAEVNDEARKTTGSLWMWLGRRDSSSCLLEARRRFTQFVVSPYRVYSVYRVRS